ncbi:hypothetical protein ACFSTA_05110 [Ornithinibacillus salinisoli]|uniref:Sporulation protein n=1 Tax=Ornithinibacillus salinisoli TaxID=1848459 RepID=A0ABW4VZX7_9BACI
MSNPKRMLFIGVVLFLLVGCTTDTNNGTNGDKNTVELTKISNLNNDIDQQPANKAKDILSQKKNVTAVKAVNTSKKLLITIEVPHHERFQLASTRKKLKDEMKKKFPKMEVELSTDQKIILEVEKLEKKLQKGSIKKKDLEKKVKKIMDLSQEQT